MRLLFDRQGKCNRRAFARITGDEQFSPMIGNDLLDNSHPQPKPAGGIIYIHCTVEPIKDVFNLFRRHAHPLIEDRNRNILFISHGLDFNRAAVRRVFYLVVQQVILYLDNTEAIHP